MEIEFPGAPKPLVAQGGEGAAATTAAAAPRSPAAGDNDGDNDSVSITRTAETLHRLETAMKALPVVDQTAVSRVREALSTGSYRIDPARVADKMVGFEARLTA